MTITERRISGACIPPVLLDHVVENPEGVRELVRRNGPYDMPDRPAGLIWPTWHANWAADGPNNPPEAAALLHHPGFIEATAEMCGSDRITPTNVHVNLGTPFQAQPVAHTDMPEFRGVGHEQAPGWFLQAMGASRLFEEERLTTITAVAWFFQGEDGSFSYWPTPDRTNRVTQTQMWNTAVVGDNDFMHHSVGRIGPEDATPASISPHATLAHDGDTWIVAEDDKIVARYTDDLVRLSISWKAKVEDDNSDLPPITLDVVFERMAESLGDSCVAASPDDLFEPASQAQLIAMWPGYWPIPDGV